ncbi:MAG: hypothetical protein ACE14P_10220 [Methanotrichaceae archaeon]
MERIRAVIESADVYKISDLFRAKPGGLRFNETDALVVEARLDDGRRFRSVFYFSLKPDGTFEEEILGIDAAKFRRHRLVSFLKYYKITEDASEYELKNKVGELRGLNVEAVSKDGNMAIYVP